MKEGKIKSMVQEESDENGGEVAEEQSSPCDGSLLRAAWLGPESSASREDEWKREAYLHGSEV